MITFATLLLLLVWPFTEAGRFLIPLVPCLLVAAVEGLSGVLARCEVRRARAWAAGAVLAVSLPYAAYAIVTDRAEAGRRTYREFDLACAWLAGAARPGPVLARHPGEVYWLTGRRSLSAASDQTQDIAGLIDRFNVAYILIDENRYANSRVSALSRYVAERPTRVREVWKMAGAPASALVVIYECGGGAGTQK